MLKKSIKYTSREMMITGLKFKIKMTKIGFELKAT